MVPSAQMEKNARMAPIARMAKKRQHGPNFRMAKKSLPGWQKSCHPPSGIGARFATTEALASPRSNPAGIPSNSVAAPKSWFPSPRVAAPKPASNPSNTHSGAAHRAAPPSSFAARRQASKSANQSPLTRALRSSLCLSQQPRPRSPRRAACPAGSLWSHQLFVAQSCLKKRICSLLCLV